MVQLATNQSGGVVGIGVVLILFVVLWAQTGGFKSQPVASSDVTVQTTNPTVNDDLDRGYLPGHVWVNQTSTSVWIAVSVADGAADWNQID